MSASTPKNFWNRFWRDEKGKIAVWQRPNLLLWTWIVATIGSRIIHDREVNQFLNIIGFGALIFWAALEITQGASYFRRLLGAIVLVAAISSRL